MEDDAQRKRSPAEPADAVAHGDAIGAARALHRAARARRRSRRRPGARRHDLGARLHARPLLGQHELAACEVAARLGQQDRDLERKQMLAVDVLMQAIVVARAIAQQERRRPRLTRLVAAGAERLVLGGVARRRGPSPRSSGRRSARAADRGCGAASTIRSGSGSAKYLYSPRPKPWLAITMRERNRASSQ